MNAPKPRRRWYQFTLRTMFVGVTLACVVLSWVGYSLNWIRQRREVRSHHSTSWDDPYLVQFSKGDETHTAPGVLWLFGEEGFSDILVWGNGDRLAKVKLLFPEAKVRHWPLD